MSYDRRGDDRRRGERRAQSAEETRREERLAVYMADIAARLRAVSVHLSAEEFDKLVRDMAEMRVRFDEIEATPDALRPIREPLDPR